TSEFSQAITGVRVNTAPTADNASVQLPDDGVVSVTLHGSDATETSDANLVYTVTTLPPGGQLVRADGTAVAVGDTFTGGPVTLQYQLRFLYGNSSDRFLYTVTDNGYPAGSGTNPLTSAAATVTLLAPADSAGIVRVGGTKGNDTIV